MSAVHVLGFCVFIAIVVVVLAMMFNDRRTDWE